MLKYKNNFLFEIILEAFLRINKEQRTQIVNTIINREKLAYYEVNLLSSLLKKVPFTNTVTNNVNVKYIKNYEESKN